MTIRIRRATAHDCPLINQMAWQVFPHTYRNILTREQTEYMMDWMYSVESLTKQLASGHTYYIAYYDDQPAGYVSIEQHEKDLFHLQDVCLPSHHLGKLHLPVEFSSLHPEACCHPAAFRSSCLRRFRQSRRCWMHRRRTTSCRGRGRCSPHHSRRTCTCRSGREHGRASRR